MAKSWTVMFYLVAEPLPEIPGLGTGTPEDLNLDDAADAELDAITKAARAVSENVQVVCQVDFQGRRNVRRLIIKSDGTTDVPLEATDENAEPGDPKALERFFDWAVTKFKSDKRAVFFWGHSFGPGGMFVTKAHVPPHNKRQVIEPGIIANPALFDSNLNESVLSLPELESALKAATPTDRPLDIVVFKDCFMNTLEVAYQLSPVVNFQLGTQFEIPIRRKTALADGSHPPAVWPYDRLFGAISNPSTGSDPATAGRAMLDALGDFYAVPDNQRDKVPATVPCSLLDLRNIADVTDELNAFVKKLEAAFPHVDDRRDKILAAKAGDSALMDVVKMCSEFSFPEASDLAKAVRRHIIGCRPSSDSTFNGLSLVYMPPTFDSIVATELFSTSYQAFRISSSTAWKSQLAFEAQSAHA